MFEWMRNFFRRHRRKLFITGAVVSGAFLIGKYLQWKVEDWQEKETLKMIERAKKQQHFESNQRTCFTTFRSFLPRLRDSIISVLNTSKIFDDLKMLDPVASEEDRLLLWNRLKSVGFSCSLCSIISTCILYLYLKVKVNIIGGYMYLQTEKQGMDPEVESVTDRQREYFTNVQHFFDVGLPRLIENIHCHVQDKMKNIALSDRFDHYQLSCLIKGTITSFLQADQEDRQFSSIGYLLDKDFIDAQGNDQSNPLTGIWRETADLLESRDFKFAFDHCIEACTEQLLRNIRSHFEYEDPEAIVETGSISSPLKQLSLPIAKIIPRVSGQTHEIFKSGRNEFLDAMFSVAVCEEFAANIYESFSSGEA